MTPAVFLDRDGTMIHDVGWLSRAEDLQWYPWTVDAIRLLNRAGFKVVVVTNQGGIALGRYPASFVEETHAAMAATLANAGAHVDAWLFCPHHPRGTIESLAMDCRCRKPAPGMAERAAADLDLDLPRSFVIGDKLTDVGLAEAFGGTGILIRTGHGEVELAAAGGTVPDGAYVEHDLMAATRRILDLAADRTEAMS